MLTDALALEYKRDYGIARRNIDVTNLIDNSLTVMGKNAETTTAENIDRQSAMVFALMARILKEVSGSGATFEEALAAVQATEAILPTVGLRSRNDIYIRT